MIATYHKYILDFKRPSGTSRGVLNQKETWFIVLTQEGKKGIGECGLLRGLSVDDRSDYEQKLQWTCENINLGEQTLYDLLVEFPSIQFGLEMAFLSLNSETPFLLYPSAFTSGQDSVAINGLIWMGSEPYMKQQIEDKIKDGFKCIKLKIGAIDFDAELEIIRSIRRHFSASAIEIRVDANGAFTASDALSKLSKLSEFKIHSIEQPIAPKQYDMMAEACKSALLPVALDEELIGVFTVEEKRQLLEKIRPQYIILKPSFIGGFRGTTEWISIAEEFQIGWWITSALESNIGLNAISQFTYTLSNALPQGLGTGELYSNNFSSPLQVRGGRSFYDNNAVWDVDQRLF